MQRALIVIFACWSIVTSVAAQETRPSNLIHRSANSATTLPANAPAGTFDTSRVVLSLAAVLALILILRWGGRRLSGSMGRSSRGIQVLSRSYLSNKHQIMIVQIGRRMLVIGDSGQQLSTLCEITDPDEAAALLGQIRGSASESSAAAVAETLRRSNDKPADEAPLITAREELNGLAEKVRVVARHLKEA